MESKALNNGDLIFNKYKIEQLLGKGNFSFVYLISDKSDKKKHFVLKEFFPNSFLIRNKNSKTYLKETLSPCKIDEYSNLKLAFRKEAENLKTISSSPHPGVMNFISFYENVNNTSYILLDYTKTIPLEKYMKSLSSPKKLIKLLKEILFTLEHIHYYNIYHQDIKVENILIKEDETPLIIDFGSSVILYDEITGKYLNTASPDCAALEQLSLNYPPEIDKSTDIYSTAALIYKIITKNYPINAKIREEAVERGEADPYITLLSKELPCFSKYTLSSIDKALNLYQEDRFQDTKTFRRALSKYNSYNEILNFFKR